MFFETREVDGETVITPIGCVFVLITLPFWVVIGLLSPVFRWIWGGSSSAYKTKPLSEETVKRRHRRFFKKISAQPEEFWGTEIQYTVTEIPKRSGGTRMLSIPSDSLKALQKHLAKAFDEELGHRVHKTANAYIKGRNTITNAVPHLGCTVLIKLDIKEFFPSVSREMIEPIIADFTLREPKAIERLLDICVTDNGLPQGAPTSPILSNLVMRDFDIAAYRFADLMSAKYTRYADDLTFSLEEDDPAAARKIVGAVRSMLAEQGFELNDKPNKLNILRGHQAQQVCGITLNSGKPTISRKQRRKVRAARHAIDNGRPASMSLASVEGWESYIGYIRQNGECPRFLERAN